MNGFACTLYCVKYYLNGREFVVLLSIAIISSKKVIFLRFLIDGGTIFALNPWTVQKSLSRRYKILSPQFSRYKFASMLFFFFLLRTLVDFKV